MNLSSQKLAIILSKQTGRISASQRSNSQFMQVWDSKIWKNPLPLVVALFPRGHWAPRRAGHCLAGQMFLAVLAPCCLAASLRETLIGEWTVAAKSAPTESLYTVEFHESGRDDSILNSTIWRDNIPTSSKFSLSEDPLIAQLQFAFPSDTEVNVTSVLPVPTPLAKLQIA
jgi:hypothetical protein